MPPSHLCRVGEVMSHLKMETSHCVRIHYEDLAPISRTSFPLLIKCGMLLTSLLNPPIKHHKKCREWLYISEHVAAAHVTSFFLHFGVLNATLVMYILYYCWIKMLKTYLKLKCNCKQKCRHVCKLNLNTTWYLHFIYFMSKSITLMVMCLFKEHTEWWQMKLHCFWF